MTARAKRTARSETRISHAPVRGTITETLIIRLSANDQKALAEGILNPNQPARTLRRAKAAHGRLIAKPR